MHQKDRLANSDNLVARLYIRRPGAASPAEYSPEKGLTSSLGLRLGYQGVWRFLPRLRPY